MDVILSLSNKLCTTTGLSILFTPSPIISGSTQENPSLEGGGGANSKGEDQPAHPLQSDQCLCYLLLGKYHIKAPGSNLATSESSLS